MIPRVKGDIFSYSLTTARSPPGQIHREVITQLRTAVLQPAKIRGGEGVPLGDRRVSPRPSAVTAGLEIGTLNPVIPFAKSVSAARRNSRCLSVSARIPVSTSFGRRSLHVPALKDQLRRGNRRNFGDPNTWPPEGPADPFAALSSARIYCGLLVKHPHQRLDT